MDPVGVIRKVDKLGRIVIPAEFRKSLGVQLGDEVEIMFKGNTVIFQKHDERCVFCGSNDNIEMLINRQVCRKCMNVILSGYTVEV